MKDILQEIIAAKRIAVEQLKRTADRSALERKIDENRSHRSMREALGGIDLGHHRRIQTAVPVERMD